DCWEFASNRRTAVSMTSARRFWPWGRPLGAGIGMTSLRPIWWRGRYECGRPHQASVSCSFHHIAQRPDRVGILRSAVRSPCAHDALAAWVVFAHVGISRLRIPSLADSIIVFLVPIPLLFANSLVGQKDIWPWF